MSSRYIQVFLNSTPDYRTSCARALGYVASVTSDNPFACIFVLKIPIVLMVTWLHNIGSVNIDGTYIDNVILSAGAVAMRPSSSATAKSGRRRGIV